MNSAEPFVFEFAGCTNYCVPQSIAVEGLAMFSAMMRDFSEFCKPKSFAFENAPVYKAFISDYFAVEKWVDRVDKCKIREALKVEGNSYLRYLFEKFMEFCEVSDCTLVIAPEDDMLLYRLSRIADKYNNLGSPSKAVKVSSDKWKVYKKLKGKVSFPETSLRPLDCKHVVKPRISCGGAGIRMMCTDFQSSEQFKSQPFKRGVMYQEYIEGIPLSVSLVVGEEAKVISLNEQILDGFEYAGARVPAPTGRKNSESVVEEVVSEAVEAVTSLKLFGYCGVDVIYGDRAYVVDVNARLTTPAVAFKAAYGINLGKVILKNFEGRDCSSDLKEKRVTPVKLVKRDLNSGKSEGEKIVEYDGSALVLINSKTRSGKNIKAQSKRYSKL